MVNRLTMLSRAGFGAN